VRVPSARLTHHRSKFSGADGDLREMQQEEYLQSLEADREKERLKAEQEALEQAIRASEMELEQNAQRQREEAEREKLDKAKALPSEPEAGESGVKVLAFRLADGSRKQRRFRGDETIQVVYDYLASLGVSCADHVVCTQRPRVVLDTPTALLQDVIAEPQVMLFVEARAHDDED